MKKGYYARKQKTDLIIQESQDEARAEIKRLKEEIKNGNTTCENYFGLLHNYGRLLDSEKYKSLLNIYAQNTIKAGIKEIADNKAVLDTYSNIASAYEYYKDYKNALYYYNKAVELYSDKAEVYLSRGFFYFDRNKRRLADMDFKKAIELEPEHEEIIEFIKNSRKSSAEGDRIIFLLWGGLILCLGGLLYNLILAIRETFKLFFG